MKQIVPGLWVIDEIGGGVNCFLWEWSDGLTLIDTGMAKDAKTILDALVRHNRPLHSVKRIVLTHADPDHSGGLPQIRRATQARVVCHAVEKEFVEHPYRRQPPALWLRPPLLLMRMLPAFAMRPVTPDELVVDGQQLPEGFTVVHTPGHSPGHIALLHREKRLLIAGDALANRNNKLTGPISLFSSDMDTARRSIWKLAKKHGDDFETVVFGHGPPLLTHGGQRVKALASQIFSAEV